jgi:hypothetical protein
MISTIPDTSRIVTDPDYFFFTWIDPILPWGVGEDGRKFLTGRQLHNSSALRNIHIACPNYFLPDPHGDKFYLREKGIA